MLPSPSRERDLLASLLGATTGNIEEDDDDEDDDDDDGMGSVSYFEAIGGIGTARKRVFGTSIAKPQGVSFWPQAKRSSTSLSDDGLLQANEPPAVDKRGRCATNAYCVIGTRGTIAGRDRWRATVSKTSLTLASCRVYLIRRRNFGTLEMRKIANYLYASDITTYMKDGNQFPQFSQGSIRSTFTG